MSKKIEDLKRQIEESGRNNRTVFVYDAIVDVLEDHEARIKKIEEQGIVQNIETQKIDTQHIASINIQS